MENLVGRIGPLILFLPVWAGACAAHSPAAPSASSTTETLVAAVVTLSASPPTSSNQVLLNVSVTTSDGRGVSDSAVTLTTTAGTLNPTTPRTSIAGQAQSLLTSSQAATVTAQVGSLTASVRTQAYGATMTVSITLSTAAPSVGDVVTLGAQVSGGSAPFGYAWNFGDNGATAAGTPVTHAYGSTGSKLVNLDVTDGNGTKVSASIILNVQASASPGPPTNPNPANGAARVSSMPILSWTATSARSYDVFFGTSNPPPLVASGLSSASYSPSGVAVLTPYYWKVVASNSAGSTAGPVWTFTTASLLELPLPLLVTIVCTPGSAPSVPASCTINALDGSNLPIPSSKIASVEWTFGDGGTASGWDPPVTHQFLVKGTYSVAAVLMLKSAYGGNSVTTTTSLTVP